MVYDSRWQESPSCAACCCGKINLQPRMSSERMKTMSVGHGQDNLEMKVLETKGNDKNKEVNDRKATNNTSTGLKREISSSGKHSMIEPQASSILMEKLGAFLLGSVWVKIMVILLFIGYLIGATVGIIDLHAFQDPVDLAPKDSYLVPVYAAFDRYFDVVGPATQFIMNKPLDYSDPEVFDEIERMVVDIRNDECFINDSSYTISWIHKYKEYLENNYDIDLIDINQSMFYDILYNEYLISDEGEYYIEDVWDALITQEVGYTTLDGLQTANNVTEIFAESIIGSSAYENILRSRVYLNLEPTGRGTKKMKLCIDNLQNLQDKYSDSLGMHQTLLFAFLMFH